MKTLFYIRRNRTKCFRTLAKLLKDGFWAQKIGSFQLEGKWMSRDRQMSLITIVLFVFTFMSLQPVAAQTVTSITPADLDTDVDASTNITLVFDQSISINDPEGKIFIFNNDDGFAVLHEFEMQDSEITVVGNTLLINPPTQLPNNTTVSVRVNSDAINGYGGLFVHRFTTVDAPTITSTSPADGATDVDSFTDLVITFSEDIMAGTSGAAYLEVSGPTTPSSAPDQILLSNMDYTINGNVLTIPDFGSETNKSQNGLDLLILDEEYTIELSPWFVTDLDGNPIYQGEYTWSFTVESSSPPNPISLSPIDGTTNVPLTGGSFTINFDEDIIPGWGFLRLVDDNGVIFENLLANELSFGTSSVTATTTVDLVAETTYSFQVFNIRDLSGSAFQTNDPDFYNFTTIDNDPPLITSFSPADDSEDVAVDATFVITFDRPIDPVNLTSEAIRFFDRDRSFQEAAALLSDDTQVTFGSNSITVQLDEDLPPVKNLSVGLSEIVMTDGNFI